jgi:N-acetylmuramoyl-L-alanine amidase
MKKIYINPGHSDRDPGAIGYETERRLNVSVSQHMRDYLLAHYDCEVKMNPGTVGDLATVCAEANKWGADLFVSNHFNAGGGDGYEVYVYSAARRSLGAIFEKHVKAAGQNSRGVKVNSKYIVLNSTNMPAVLNESAFVDNKNDILAWNDDSELKKLGTAYAKAAAEYLGMKEKASSTSQYSLTQFIKDVQKACGASVDGIAGSGTISKTVTLSRYKNSTHAAVKPVQKRLYALGYTQVGTADGVAGAKFAAAVKAFQKDNGCWVDGVITAKNKTWRKLLGMK